MTSSDSVSSPGSLLSLDSALSNEETVRMVSKGVQAGKSLEFKFCIDVDLPLQHTYLTLK
jgi:hypothetical protein